MNAKSLSRAVLIALFLLGASAASQAHFFDAGVSVGFAPPPLPVYEQPPVPGPGYIWTPGYWAYADDTGYYWVPGTWVLAPAPGLLWTPGYWDAVNNYYLWHAGYWGPHVGFYGGINYGCGYFGFGFEGGYWRDREFFYNRAFTNVRNVNITNVYNNGTTRNYFASNRASYNGGDGVHARPGRSEIAAAHEPHRGMTSLQTLQETSARSTPALRAAVNHGQPSIAATPRPGVFDGRGTDSASHAAPGAASSGRASPQPLRAPAFEARTRPANWGSDAAGQARSTLAAQNDRPAWARSTSQSAHGTTRQDALRAQDPPLRSSAVRPPAYAHPTARPSATYARAQSPNFTRPYIPQKLPARAQPRAPQQAVQHSNAAAVRSPAPQRLNAPAPRHEARHA